MYYQKFEEKVKECISKRLSDEYELLFMDTIKNNGMKLRGLIIREKKSEVSPTIYLNSFYEAYLGGEDVESIADNIIDLYEKHKLEVNINPEILESFESVKEMLFAKLINRDKNSELLADTPCCEFLDLAVVLYVDLTELVGMPATVLVKNKFIEMWKESRKDIFDYAIKNTREKKGVYLEDISRIIDQCKIVEEDMNEFSDKMFIFSNMDKFYGSLVMIYEDEIKKFCFENNKDLYIIPSSIHEVILMPAYDKEDYERINDIIEAVNDSQLSREEVLSDHAYYYSVRDGYEMI